MTRTPAAALNDAAKPDKADLFEKYWRMFGNDAPYEREYKFAKPLGRRHRFDFAFIEWRLAVEIDGGQWQAHGGRHAGEADKVKMNLAAMLGWRVMHYTPQMIEVDPVKVIDQVKIALDWKS